MVEGSLSGGARLLGLTQPTLGRHIEQLEAMLGLPLFTRSPQGLSPTKAAEDLLPHVAGMAAAADALIRQASGDADHDRGTIRLTASDIFGGRVLPKLLPPFMDAHPQIEIELVLSNRLGDLLRREADIAVRMVRPEQGALTAKRIGEVEIGFYAHRDYVEKYGRPHELEDLRTHRLIGYDRDPSAPGFVERLGIAFDPSLFRLRTDHDMAALAALEAGIGIGGCERALAAANPDLVPVLNDVVLARYDVWLAMHQDLSASRRMRLLFDYLAEGLARHVAAGRAARASLVQSSG